MFDPVRDITDKTGQDIVNALKGVAAAAAVEKPNGRVTSLDATKLAAGGIVEAVGVPVFVDDITQFAEFNLTEKGWYVFARIASRQLGITAQAVEGADGYVIGGGYVDVAVRFEVASMSKVILVTWASGDDETFIFKASDLAIRNLDYRVTFYVYDIEDPDHNYAHWEYALTTDTTFDAEKYYYTKDGDNYTLATVTAGEAIPADTYYVHSKVTFSGMTRNITYVCNTPIDCPSVFDLPEIEDETHGCWFEIRLQHTGSFSSTLKVPEGVKVATEHTQAETAGINMVDLHYTAIGNTKVWRFMNTHSSIPA